MKELYNKIQQEIEKIDFNKLWPGFYKIKFALYDKTNVYLENKIIPYDNRFIGNTSIKYNDEYIAIWYVEDPKKENYQELAANIVHEMFHGFQQNNNETRFPNELIGLDYPEILLNYQIKYLESQKLVTAIEEYDVIKKRALLENIISLRIERLNQFGNNIKYEYAIETVEGCAEYCGIKALKEISNTLYNKKIRRYKEQISFNKNLLFDVRRYNYYTGSLLMLLIDELEIKISRIINGQTDTIFDELIKLLNVDTYDYNNELDQSINILYQQYIIDKKKMFTDFFENEPKQIQGDYTMVGYDPMNMKKQNNYIIHNHMVMLYDNKSQNKLFLEGPVITEMDRDKVKSYYRIIE